MPRKVDCELVLVPPKEAEVVVDSCMVETEIGRTTATCFIVAGTGTASTSAVEAGEETMASANTRTKVLVETVGGPAVKTRVGTIVGTWLRITAGHAVGTNSGRTTATCFVVAGTGTASTSAVEAGEETMASANTSTKVLVETVGCGAVKTRVRAVVGTWLRTTTGHAVGTNSSSWGVKAAVRVLVLVLVSLVRL